MSAWLPMVAGMAGVLLSLCVLWPLRRRGRRGFLLACVSVGVAVAGLYLLVGDPRAAQVPAAPSVADLRDGVQALEDSLQRDPQRADGWALLGRARAELGQMPTAADAFARAVKLAPDDAGLLVEAAQARAQAHPGKQFDDVALQWLQHALQVQPDAERAAWLLGIALRQRGRDAEAVAVWSALLPRLQEGAATALREQISLVRDSMASGETGAGPAVAAPVRSNPLPDASAAGTSLTVRVVLPQGFDATGWPPDAALFVLARVPDGPPMPVAVRRYPLDALPSQVTLGDADSPMPTQPLSAHARVELLARLSRDGSPGGGSGDLRSEPLRVDLPHQGVLELQLR